jgi:hypothetical protein
MTVSGQRHAPAALPLGKKPGTDWVGGWVGPSAGLDGWGKSRPYRVSIPGHTSLQRVAIPTELPAQTAGGLRDLIDSSWLQKSNPYMPVFLPVKEK